MHFTPKTLPLALALLASPLLASPTPPPSPSSDSLLHGEIFAPQTVAIPPTFASRDLCRLDSGEIRHYGYRQIQGKPRRVFLSSLDQGLSWKLHLAHSPLAGAMVKSPYGGDWLYFTRWRDGEPRNVFLLRSKTGPDDPSPSITPTGWHARELRQILPMRSRKRWIAGFSDVRCENGECYHSSFAYSDDDGVSWKLVDVPPVPNIPRTFPGDRRPHWFNNGCEPTLAELSDGSLLMAVRTSGETHWVYSSPDGGETWSRPRPMHGFWCSNTMPYFFRLRDGRLLFFWNNTSPLPTCHPSEIPEASPGELAGHWETFFTNRDALHAAISSDDGKTWRGFREIILNECRNAPDFRQLGAAEKQEGDKSVHQTQAIELDDGKILLALGQNSAARRIVIFHPDWLLEKSRTENFRNGLGSVSTHLYLKSLSGGGWESKGWSGHCSYNRIPGAVLLREPESNRAAPARRESLFFARLKDERLVSDRQGVVWNFPAGRSGKAEIEFRIEGCGFRFTLADRWINPSDPVTPLHAPFTFLVAPTHAEPGKWHRLTAEWDAPSGTVTLKCGGKTLCTRKMAYAPAHGLSYLHLQSSAETEDRAGNYIRTLSAQIK